MSNYKIISIEGNIGSGKSTLLENLRKYYNGNSRVIFLKEPVDDWEKIKDKQGNTMLKKFYADQEKYSFAFQMMAYISRLTILRDTVKEIKEKSPPSYVPKISNELAEFLEKPIGSEMERIDITQEINKYIRIHGLQDKKNGRKINPNDELQTLLKIKNTDELSFFNLQRYLTPHFSKSENQDPELPQYIIITERSLYTDKHVFAKMLHDQGKIEDVCYQIYLKWFEEFAKDFPINYSVYVKTDPTNCYNRIHKRSRDGEEVIPLAYLQDCHTYHEEFLNGNDNTKPLVLDGNVDIYENKNIMDNWLNKINEFVL